MLFRSPSENAEFSPRPLDLTDEEADRRAAARWVVRVLRPAVEGFAVARTLEGYAALVSSTETGTEIELLRTCCPEVTFKACLGLAAPDSGARAGALDCRLPGVAHPFAGRGCETVDAAMVADALHDSFDRWLSDGERE